MQQNLYHYCSIKCAFFCSLQKQDTTFRTEDISENVTWCNLCSHTKNIAYVTTHTITNVIYTWQEELVKR